MSAWQFKTTLLPTSGLIARHDKIPETVEIVRFSDSVSIEVLEQRSENLPNYWEEFSEADAFEAAIAGLLPERESWSVLAKMFGSAGENEIEIWKTKTNALSRVAVLFNLGAPDSHFIQAVLALASTFKCVLLAIQSGHIFLPSTSSFIAEAEKCSAAKFVPRDKQLASLLDE